MKKAYFLTPKLQGRKNEYLYTPLYNDEQIGSASWLE